MGTQNHNERSRTANSFDVQAKRKWMELIQELERAGEECRRRDGKVEFKRASDCECRVSNPDAGVALVLAADITAHTIHYDYQPEQKNVAVPEGGFLSLRAADSGITFYSADQQLTTEQARRLLLEPLLLPPVPSVEQRTAT